MNMDGKVTVVTGGNSGIGLETARGLARAGALVVLAVRDVAKGAQAREEILRSEPRAKIEVLPLDLGSQQSIRAFVQELDARFKRLDVLVNNAALVPATRTLTSDGLETQFGVNHIGPFMLTTLLLPKLKSSAPSRVVVVSSSVYKGKTLDFDDLQAEKGYSQMGAYTRSKLMNMLFVRALSKRLEGTGVTVNALHPGVVSTSLAREMPAPFRVIARFMFSTPEKGARTSIFLATSPAVSQVSGKYFAASKEQPLDAAALDDSAAERLWQVSAKLAGV